MHVADRCSCGTMSTSSCARSLTAYARYGRAGSKAAAKMRLPFRPLHACARGGVWRDCTCTVACEGVSVTTMLPTARSERGGVGGGRRWGGHVCKHVSACTGAVCEADRRP